MTERARIALDAQLEAIDFKALKELAVAPYEWATACAIE